MKDGGPAFPRASSMDGDTEAWSQDGMSLRDYFAAHAPIDTSVLGAYISAEQRDVVMQRVAENAYRWADAMLKAREGRDS